MEGQSGGGEKQMKTHQGRSPWFRLMLIAFFANGFGPLGLKVLAEHRLSNSHELQYLFFWYLSGAAFAAVFFFRRSLRVTRGEILLGALMGLCSLGGQFFTGMALAANVAGHVVFPVTTGGSLFLVAAAGLLFFREKVGWYGLTGIGVGILALIVLSSGG
jgi:drug/metabolite transporter (DMT)-like permease